MSNCRLQMKPLFMIVFAVSWKLTCECFFQNFLPVALAPRQRLKILSEAFKTGKLHVNLHRLSYRLTSLLNQIYKDKLNYSEAVHKENLDFDQK